LQIFIALFAQAFPERLNLLQLDRRSAHLTRRLTLREAVRPVCLLPYGPELNPIGRVWCDLKEALAWLSFPTLEELYDVVAMLLPGL
jgi:transposase